MKKAVASVMLAFLLVLNVAAGAKAHYDPWTTHWHYSDGVRTYKMCSWWDSLWGCKNGY